MRTVYLKKKPVNLLDYKQRRAKPEDCSISINEECRIIDEDSGKAIALYCKPQGEDAVFDDLYEACSTTKFTTHPRTNGMVSTSKIFGYNPRNAIRKDFCSVAHYAREQPQQHNAVVMAGVLAAKYYALHNPELYASHLQTTTEKINEDYRLLDLPFTSGIVNENNPLAYHFDSGNFKNVWSAMIVLKRDIAGGYLAMPEYDALVEVADKSIFYFDGQSILHGVTPISKLNEQARRYSIVYYSLQAMWNCQPLREEIARARMRREQVEHNRLTKKRTNGSQ